jgi:toxin ParE1/3/4
MATVTISPRGLQDIAEIAVDLQTRAGVRVAREYARRIEDRIDLLRDFPGGGAPRPKLGRAIRIAIVDPYIIFHRHRLGSDGLTVPRVLDGRRRITRKLVREGGAT